MEYVLRNHQYLTTFAFFFIHALYAEEGQFHARQGVQFDEWNMILEGKVMIADLNQVLVQPDL